MGSFEMRRSCTVKGFPSVPARKKRDRKKSEAESVTRGSGEPHTRAQHEQTESDESTVTRATYTHTRTQTRTQTPQAKTICHEKRDRETERDISDRFCRHAPIPWRLRSACASMRASVFPAEPKTIQKRFLVISRACLGKWLHSCLLVLSLSWQDYSFIHSFIHLNGRLSPMKTAQKT